MKKKWLIGIIITGVILIGACSTDTTDKSTSGSNTTQIEKTEPKPKEEPIKEPIKEPVKEEVTKEVKDKPVKKEPVKTIVSKESVMKEIKQILTSTMGDVTQFIDVYELNGYIMIDIIPFDGFVLAAKTLGPENTDYKTVINNFKDISKTSKESFEIAGHNIDVMLAIRNDQNKDNVLLTFLNGAKILDYIN